MTGTLEFNEPIIFSGSLLVLGFDCGLEERIETIMVSFCCSAYNI